MKARHHFVRVFKWIIVQWTLSKYVRLSLSGRRGTSGGLLRARTLRCIRGRRALAYLKDWSSFTIRRQRVRFLLFQYLCYLPFSLLSLRI